MSWSRKAALLLSLIATWAMGVQDGWGQALKTGAQRPLDEVPPALVLNCTPTTGPAALGTFYSANCSASGGTPAYNWSTSPLPAGVTLTVSPVSNSVATISGTPTATGPYNYTVTVTDSGTPSPQTASQSYAGTIEPAGVPTLSAGPPTLPFGSYTIGGAPPAAQTITVNSTPGSVGFATVLGEDCAWLILKGPNVTPASIVASVNIAALTSPGSHSCSITFNSPNVPETPTVTATVTATTPTSLSAVPATLNFGTYVIGGNPPSSQPIAVSSANPASGVNFTTALGADCAWLALQGANVTPASITASVNTATLTSPGSHSCSITFNAPNVLASPVVTATLTVNSPTSLSAAPATLNFGTYVIGGNTPSSQTIAVSSANPASGVGFTTSLGADCAWLTLNGPSVTPASITASVNTATLTSAGSHSCSITFNAPNVPASPVVTATLTVNSPTSLSAAPATLNFGTYVIGGNPPPSQTIVVSSTNPASGIGFTTSLGADCAWASLTGPAVTPASVVVSVAPATLTTAGVHSCSISLSRVAVTNVPAPFAVITATLTVNAQTPSLSAAPATLSFGSYFTAGPAPGSQVINVSSSNPSSGVNFETSLGADCAWLALSGPAATPATITASVNTASSIATGSHSCTITFSVPGVAPSPTVVATLNVNPLALTCQPNGPTTVGTAYSANCRVVGGTPPYSWSISAGSLPAGLSLSGMTGSGITIGGTPTALGGYRYSVSVTDASLPAPRSASQSYTGTIQAAPLSITCSVASGPSIAGTPYSATCSATGGNPPYIWSIVGTLPSGLSLSSTTGSSVTLSGTPGAAGAFSYSIQVGDSTAPKPASTSQAYTGTIQAAPLSITCSAASGPSIAGTPYSTTCNATGGNPPYTWSIVGTLPSGLSLSSTTGTSVTLSGTPGAAGAFSYSIQVGDSTAPKAAGASQAYTGTIQTAPPSITCSAASGPSMAGTPYSTTCNATGGNPPYIWSIIGTLPSGLSLSSTTGTSVTLSGTPGAAGAFSYSIQVSDSTAPKPASASQAYSGTVAPAPLAATCSRGSNAVVGSPYSGDCTASGGTPPYRWSISAGTLADGLSLNATSGATVAISGTPTAPGSVNATVQVTDSSGTSATAAISLTIGLPAAPSVDFGALPATVDPATQISWTVALGATYPVEIGGQVVLAFTPNAGDPDDPAIQFSNGSRTATFTIPAGSLQGTSPVAFQTGTVTGNIMLTVHLSAANQDITASPAPNHSTTVNALTAITDVSLAQSSGGFDVVVTGYASSRQVSQANFQFSAAAGGNLQTTQLTVPVSSIFNDWYQSRNSAAFGSLFTYTQHFAVQGSVGSISSVTVTLDGSQPATGTF